MGGGELFGVFSCCCLLFLFLHSHLSLSLSRPEVTLCD